jgi:hypothetical protein
MLQEKLQPDAQPFQISLSIPTLDQTPQQEDDLSIGRVPRIERQSQSHSNSAKFQHVVSSGSTLEFLREAPDPVSPFCTLLGDIFDLDLPLYAIPSDESSDAC